MNLSYDNPYNYPIQYNSIILNNNLIKCILQINLTAAFATHHASTNAVHVTLAIVVQHATKPINKNAKEPHPNLPLISLHFHRHKTLSKQIPSKMRILEYLSINYYYYKLVHKFVNYLLILPFVLE